MLSKPQIKYIRTLQLKKFRQKHGVFIAEGEKLIDDLLQGDSEIRTIFGLEDWLKSRKAQLEGRSVDIHEITEKELKQISRLSTPNNAVAIVKIPTHKFSEKLSKNKIYPVLDDIRDPGNMGTIIRTADWFGFHEIFCSPDCVDIFNPKVVQASMGSIARVKIHVADLFELFSNNESIPVFGAVLDGQNIYEMKETKSGFILFGNEAHGISQSLINKVSYPITIPSDGKAESLNAAISVGIVLSEFKRNFLV